MNNMKTTEKLVTKVSDKDYSTINYYVSHPWTYNIPGKLDYKLSDEEKLCIEIL